MSSLYMLQLYFSPVIYVVMLRQLIHIVGSLKFSKFQVKHLRLGVINNAVSVFDFC